MAKFRKRSALAKQVDPAFAEAMRDARDIREWTHGPKVDGWLVYRLALALTGRGGFVAKPIAERDRDPVLWGDNG